MTSHAIKGSDIFIRALENEGVEYVFGVPGEENLDMLESLRTSRIKVVVTRHEQVAGFMAATYGRLTGKPGVCLSTLGPGATNLVTAAAHASLGGMPMLMITGQKPVLQSRQAQFQIIDTVSMMRPLTKSAKQAIDAGNIPTLVRDAFRMAEAERPGPVHLELPEDIAAQLTERSAVVPVSATFRTVAAEEAIVRAAAAIAAARNPLVMIGGGANRPGLAPALSAAVRRLEVPFFNTQMGKGAVDGNSELFVGTAALSEGDYVHLAIERADLIVAVGHDTAEKPPFIMRAGGPQVVHIDFNVADIDQIYFPQVEVVGDIADSMARLASELDGKLTHDPIYFQEIRAQILEHVAEGADDPRYPLARQWHVQDLVRPELSHPHRQHDPARQRAGYDGGRSGLGHDGGTSLPRSARHGHLRRRRVHDELAGFGDRHPAWLEPRCAHHRGPRLRHDSLETRIDGLRRFRTLIREPRFRQICRGLWG
jgi:acetolactate synthase I/II/III large subunit